MLPHSSLSSEDRRKPFLTRGQENIILLKCQLLYMICQLFYMNQGRCGNLIHNFFKKILYSGIFYLKVMNFFLQMLQACSVQHLPVPYAAFPPLISSDPFLIHPPHLSPHHPPHLPPPGQFVPFQTQQSRSVGISLRASSFSRMLRLG